jgi:hypothetical protein
MRETSLRFAFTVSLRRAPQRHRQSTSPREQPVWSARASSEASEVVFLDAKGHDAAFALPGPESSLTGGSLPRGAVGRRAPTTRFGMPRARKNLARHRPQGLGGGHVSRVRLSLLSGGFDFATWQDGFPKVLFRVFWFRCVGIRFPVIPRSCLIRTEVRGFRFPPPPLNKHWRSLRFDLGWQNHWQEPAGKLPLFLVFHSFPIGKTISLAVCRSTSSLVSSPHGIDHSHEAYARTHCGPSK